MSLQGACKSILVIEDDDDIRQVIRVYLELEGYPVFTAANGKQALEMLAKIPRPGLIFLDLMMPIMNGWQFVELLHGDTDLSTIPVVVVTADTSTVRSISAKRVIHKPFDPDVLYEVAREYCVTPI